MEKMLPKIDEKMTTKDIIIAYLNDIRNDQTIKKIYRYVIMLWLME
mgnify:CR=1 FL=1